MDYYVGDISQRTKIQNDRPSGAPRRMGELSNFHKIDQTVAGRYRV